MSVATEIETGVKEVLSAFPDADEDRVVNELEQYVNEYSVPIESATEQVKRKLRKEKARDTSTKTKSGGKTRKIGELSRENDDEFFSVEGKVMQIDNNPDSPLAQKGKIADGTGECRFKIFESSVESNTNILLEKGKSYRLAGVVGDYYKGYISIKIHRKTNVMERETEIEDIQRGQKKSISGTIVKLHQGTGLVKECSVDGCFRRMSGDSCDEHGVVEGHTTLKILATVDTGVETHKIVCDEAVVESVADIDVQEAIELAEYQEDKQIVFSKIRGEIICRNYDIVGRKRGNFVYVDEMGLQSKPDIDRFKQLKRSVSKGHNIGEKPDLHTGPPTEEEEIDPYTRAVTGRLTATELRDALGQFTLPNDPNDTVYTVFPTGLVAHRVFIAGVPQKVVKASNNRYAVKILDLSPDSVWLRTNQHTELQATDAIRSIRENEGERVLVGVVGKVLMSEEEDAWNVEINPERISPLNVGTVGRQVEAVSSRTLARINAMESGLETALPNADLPRKQPSNLEQYKGAVGTLIQRYLQAF